MERILTISTALVVVDMINAFIQGEPLKPLRKELTARVNELVDAAKEKGIPVVNIRTQHERSKSTCAAEAYARNREVILAKDAIASNLPDVHERTLELLNAEYRQPILSNEEILRDVFGVS